jgi:hypothetical protein
MIEIAPRNYLDVQIITKILTINLKKRKKN